MLPKSSERDSYYKEILNSIPRENLVLQSIFGSNLFAGVAVVKNEKLAGRLEDVKFLDSFEPTLRDQFLKEGKILSAINHPNIPKVYDIFEHEDLILFRSEHIEGFTLREIIDGFSQRKESFPENAARLILKKLLSALDYAHNKVHYHGETKSLIHCDIKPENILLKVNGISRGDVDDTVLDSIRRCKIEPYLIDFGIARFKEEFSDSSGTLQYLSPDQINEKSLDWRTDIYQLSLVYFELLSGVTPYSKMGRSKVIESKRSSDFKVLGREYLPRTLKSEDLFDSMTFDRPILE